MEAFYVNCLEILKGEIWRGLTRQISDCSQASKRNKIKSANNILSTCVISSASCRQRLPITVLSYINTESDIQCIFMKNPLYLTLSQRLGLKQTNKKMYFYCSGNITGQSRIQDVFVSVMVVIYKYGFLNVKNEHTALKNCHHWPFYSFQIQDLPV